MALTKSLSFSLGRKRVLISNNSCDLEHFCADFESFTPLKRQHCNDVAEYNCFRSSFSLLEALPQDALIEVIRHVNHEDLKQLYLVSKTVRDAAMIAKKEHFAFSTPSKVKAFRNEIDLSNTDLNSDDLEAPNAPKRARRVSRSRIGSKKLDDISVVLFPDESDDEQRSPRRSLLFIES